MRNAVVFPSLPWMRALPPIPNQVEGLYRTLAKFGAFTKKEEDAILSKWTLSLDNAKLLNF